MKLEFLKKHKEFIIIFFLLLCFRGMACFWFYGVPWSEFRDFHYKLCYSKESPLSEKIPYIQYWLEYPPLFPVYLRQVERVLRAFNPNYDSTPNMAIINFQIASSLSMVPFELGTFLLMYLILIKLRGISWAIAMARYFPIFFMILFVTLSYFDFMALFFLLLGAYLLIHDRLLASALFTGIGIMVKIIPLILIPLSFVYIKEWRKRIVFIIMTIAVSFFILIPFIIKNPRYAFAPFLVNATKKPWETIWAIMERQYTHGSLMGIDRLSTKFLNERSLTGINQILYLAAGLLFFFLVIVAFKKLWKVSSNNLFSSMFLFLTSLFFLYSKGWSPQFIVFFIPAIFFHFETEMALLFITVFSIINFIEMPIWLFYYSSSRYLLITCIMLRTMLIAYFAFKSFVDLSKLKQDTNETGPINDMGPVKGN